MEQDLKKIFKSLDEINFIDDNTLQKILKYYFEIKDVKNLKYLAKGKRSIVFEGIFQNEKVVIKFSNNLKKEILFLERLEKYFFVPKIYFSNNKYMILEKAEKDTIKKFLENPKILNEKKIKVINKVIEACKILDELKINKFEMTNPYKHIFVDKNQGIKLIDFERCRFTTRPKNLNQFKEYIKKFDLN